jgi:hypothetical protein
VLFSAAGDLLKLDAPKPVGSILIRSGAERILRGADEHDCLIALIEIGQVDPQHILVVHETESIGHKAGSWL